MAYARLVNGAVPAAGTYHTEPWSLGRDPQYIAAEGNLDYGSGGTSLKAYLQVSLDEGATWNDVICFAFATADARKQSVVNSSVALAAAVTPTDGTLADNTILNGLIGSKVRVKTVVAGTYVASTFAFHVVVR